MKLLLIEDETALAHSIQEYLKGHHFVCEWVSTLSDALEKVGSYDYDCILLDLNLPDGDGFTLLKALQKLQKTEGVIIVSAKETLDSKLEGFSLGADDYLTKPFHLSELLMRVLALIRRKSFQGSNHIVFQEIAIDILTKSVCVHDQEIILTKTEYDLLLYFISNMHKVLAKSAIAEHLSGDMADMLDNHDFVYAHIKNLKKKIADGGGLDYIHSVYGLGYRWSNE